MVGYLGGFSLCCAFSNKNGYLYFSGIFSSSSFRPGLVLLPARSNGATKWSFSATIVGPECPGLESIQCTHSVKRKNSSINSSNNSDLQSLWIQYIIGKTTKRPMRSVLQPSQTSHRQPKVGGGAEGGADGPEFSGATSIYTVTHTKFTLFDQVPCSLFTYAIG